LRLGEVLAREPLAAWGEDEYRELLHGGGYASQRARGDRDPDRERIAGNLPGVGLAGVRSRTPPA
jgi:hypothetical protein